MNNYKIRVNNEAESREAQELLFCLGCEWPNGREFSASHNKGQNAIGFFEDKEICLVWVYPDTSPRFQELTLPQLRDLVVLHRNDVKDATHRDKRDKSIYLTSDKVIYYWQGEWCKSAINKSNDYENYIANSLTPITQPKDPALISGDVALRALADGKEVQCTITGKNDWTKDIYGIQPYYFLGGGVGQFQFRLKPRTIKLELEIPAPFEPSECEEFYVLSSVQPTGYIRTHLKSHALLGAWRTEAEIKIVVEQLRKLKEHSK